MGYDDPRIAATVAEDFNAYAPEVRTAALTLIASRAGWSLTLAQAVEDGKISAASLPLETVRQMKRHKGESLARLIARHWPQTGSPTSEAMKQQVNQFVGVLRSGKGDPYRGQELFNATCASCHKLFARGGNVGPDLTSYQRGDLDTMLLHVVNPSAEIREGYENFLIETKDERSLNGFLVERDTKVVVLRGADGQNITLEQKDISEMRAAGLSLMPEGLLDNLNEQELRDLFAYLRSTQPLAN
jgi:putative heme-binding domain-containing protein